MWKYQSFGPTGSSAQVQRDLRGALGHLHLPRPTATATATATPTAAPASAGKFTRTHVDAPPPPYTASQSEPATAPAGKAPMADAPGNYQQGGQSQSCLLGALALGLEDSHRDGFAGSVRNVLADFFAFVTGILTMLLNFVDGNLAGLRSFADGNLTGLRSFADGNLTGLRNFAVFIGTNLGRFLRKALKTLYLTAVLGIALFVILFICFPPFRDIVVA
ncbi:hypothetical protein DL95DRAFT_444352 [Leptodontidium sp. 2 PMI_412]|nr:hypothetical protein DL95DRAFT_444352 [Leptodontidium sp. 2 PMI_412]